MIPAFSVVGKSNSGKTTLIEKLVTELKRRGYRVGTVKHDVHGFEVDHEGKDTWRHRQAGADVVVIASPDKMAMIESLSGELPLGDILARVRGVDLIVTEGFKRGPLPKLEVLRSARSRELLCAEDPQLFAIASDVPLNGTAAAAAPVFEWNDATGLVDLIERRFLGAGAP